MGPLMHVCRCRSADTLMSGFPMIGHASQHEFARRGCGAGGARWTRLIGPLALHDRLVEVRQAQHGAASAATTPQIRLSLHSSTTRPQENLSLPKQRVTHTNRCATKSGSRGRPTHSHPASHSERSCAPRRRSAELGDGVRENSMSLGSGVARTQYPASRCSSSSCAESIRNHIRSVRSSLNVVVSTNSDWEVFPVSPVAEAPSAHRLELCLLLSPFTWRCAGGARAPYARRIVGRRAPWRARRLCGHRSADSPARHQESCCRAGCTSV